MNTRSIGCEAALILFSVLANLNLAQSQTNRKAQYCTLSARLTNASGEPISNAAVMITPGEIGSRTVTHTGEEGRFVVTVQMNRNYTELLEAPGFASRSLPLIAHSCPKRYQDLDDVKLTPSTSRTESAIPELPQNVFTFIQNDFRSGDCLRENGLQFEQTIDITWLSLGGKGDDALLVNGLGPCLAGNVNGPIAVYAHLDEGWRKVLDVNGRDVEPLSGRTHGFSNVEVWSHGSATESVRVVYKFDGRQYNAVQCEDVKYEDEKDKPKVTPCKWDWKK